MRRPDDRLQWAESRLTHCRRIALRHFGTRVRVERKADDSPVTRADRAIEEYLRRELGRAFPGEAIVGEEFGATASQPESFWTIDPIDGTRAFSRGLPSWGILLGWVERGAPTLAACDFPAVSAFLGVGPRTPAFERRGSQRIRLARAPKPPSMRDAVIFHGGSSWWLQSPYAAGFARLARGCYLERAYGDCYAYLWALRGCAEAMIDYGVKVWDLAPFAALAAATGRVMIDCHGAPTWTGPESILAHPSLAKQIADLLRHP